MDFIVSLFTAPVPDTVTVWCTVALCFFVFVKVFLELIVNLIQSSNSFILARGAPLTELSMTMLVLSTISTLILWFTSRELARVRFRMAANVSAFLTTLALGYCNISAVTSGYGMPSVSLTDSQLQGALFWFWAAQVSYALAMMSNNLALLDFGLALFGHVQAFQHFVLGLKAVAMAGSGVSTALTISQCSPLQQYWTSDDSPSECWLSLKSVGIWNGLGPLIIYPPFLVILIQVLWFRQANMTPLAGRLRAPTMILAISTLSTVFAFLRMFSLPANSEPFDRSSDTIGSAIWATWQVLAVNVMTNGLVIPALYMRVKTCIKDRLAARRRARAQNRDEEEPPIELTDMGTASEEVEPPIELTNMGAASEE